LIIARDNFSFQAINCHEALVAFLLRRETLHREIFFRVFSV